MLTSMAPPLAADGKHSQLLPRLSSGALRWFSTTFFGEKTLWFSTIVKQQFSFSCEKTLDTLNKQCWFPPIKLPPL